MENSQNAYAGRLMRRAYVSGTVYGKCGKKILIPQKLSKTLEKQAKSTFRACQKILILHGYLKPS